MLGGEGVRPNAPENLYWRITYENGAPCVHKRAYKCLANFNEFAVPSRPSGSRDERPAMKGPGEVVAGALASLVSSPGGSDQGSPDATDSSRLSRLHVKAQK